MLASPASLLGLPDEEAAKVFGAMSPEELVWMDEILTRYLWLPLPGPQEEAFYSQADELFYGGAAGGGKSDLLLGVAITQHRRSVIFRREYAQLSWFIDRSTELLVGRAKFNGGSPPRWTFPDSRRIEFAGCQQPKDVRKFMGRPHDFRGFDELSEIQEQQFRFLAGWVRTTVVGQRTRLIGAGNPPLTAEGEWVNKYWGPWLDDRYANPAEPGKLRWFIQDGDSDREVEGPEPVRLRGETVKPKSRTFIKASLADNPFLERTGYRAQLQALPEPLRSMLLEGRFDVAKTDQAMQVIPTAWILAAEARWEELARQGFKPGPMDALGVDVAWGGADKTVLTRRHATWFGQQLAVPGVKTPTGDHTAALVLQVLGGARAAVNIDVIGTGGGAAFSVLQANKVRAFAMVGSLGSKKRDRTNSFGFANKRSQWYWELRDALEPGKGDDLALPPDRELRADLAAPTFRLTAKGVQVEKKDDIRERLGRSPDKGDSLVYAHATDGLASLAGVSFGEDLGRESPWRGRA